MFSSNKKIESKRWHLYFLAIFIIAAVVIKVNSYRWPKAEAIIGGERLTILVADTPAHRFEGWSKKEDMGKYQGMLFVFPNRGQHTMVMRNMRFPLDIVWLDGLKIVDIAPSVAIEPDKAESELNPYFARFPSTFVLELPGGFMAQHGVKILDTVEIKEL